jgi:hypothetical protein
MVPIHIRNGEGSRLNQYWAMCTGSDHNNSSDGQVGNICSTEYIEEATCSYCKWIYAKNNGFPQRAKLIVHWSVHPVFLRDGTGRFSHFEAWCGKVNIEEEHVLATRDFGEVTCIECQNAVREG